MQNRIIVRPAGTGLPLEGPVSVMQQATGVIPKHKKFTTRREGENGVIEGADLDQSDADAIKAGYPGLDSEFAAGGAPERSE